MSSPPSQLGRASGALPGTAPRRILILNQFVPPDPAPTARLLGDVAEALRERGHTVSVVGDRLDYRGTKSLLGSRALREATSLARLFLKALLAERADVIVCLTSPPLLLVVANGLRLRHRGARLVHWAMDLYPEVAVALGDLRETSALNRFCAAAMAAAYRRCDLVVALDEEMSARIGETKGPKRVQPPWPPESGGWSPPAPSPPDVPFEWLYSGNLGRAHEWETLLEAQAMLEDKSLEIDLVFQGDGTEFSKAHARAAELGLKRCRWRPYAVSERLIPTLLAAGALIVTQRPETAGCLWPSKLALVRLLDRPILWIGPKTGGISESLRSEKQDAFAPGEAAALAERVASLAKSPRAPSPSPALLAERIGEARRRGIDRVVEAIEPCLVDPTSHDPRARFRT